MRLQLLHRFNRPFSNSPRALFYGLTAVWVLAILAQPCNEPPYYLEITFATFTVTVAVWVAHLRVGSAHSWRAVVAIAFGALYDLLMLLLTVLLISIPVALFQPAYQCYTTRAKVGEVILGASAYRTEINERFAVQKTLQGIGNGLNVEKEGRIKGGFITSDGDIVLVSEAPTAVVLMTPVPSKGELEWKCLGYPSKSMPGPCRQHN